MNKNKLLALSALALGLTQAALAQTTPSYLLGQGTGTTTDMLILAQFAANGTTSTTQQFNYGQIDATQQSVASLADFNGDGVLDVVVGGTNNVGAFGWELRLMKDDGTVYNSRKNFSPFRRIMISVGSDTTNLTEFSQSMGSRTLASGDTEFFLRNAATGEIRGMRIHQTGAVYAITGHSSFFPQSVNWPTAVGMYSDPTSPGDPAFFVVDSTNTHIAIYRSANGTTNPILGPIDAPIYYGGTTHPMGGLDVTGDGADDIMVVPPTTVKRRVWILDANSKLVGNQPVLGVKPSFTGWNLLAWGGGTGH